ncbi:hypothetical protein FLAN108750_08340 [Flavobacterium antarcticum]|uniref:hypothetical protein n=1 Tax=Flavobacterium antarcticum TaxID=271155 RepID=UPI0003B4C910|nr:hypothetical protein [Flavobacterium antarcticum]
MKQIFILAVTAALLMSCKDEVKTTETDKTTVIEHVQTTDETSDAITLNNGEQWVVNEEMKPFVMKSEAILDAYVKNNGTDYKKLAQDIKDQNDLLIKSCTMEGPSHDELHKWLHPHLELVGKLAETEDAAKAKEMVAELQTSYQMYHQYFN